MTARELSYEEINRVMEQLQREGIDISRNAVVTMLDTGILTEPRKLDDYLRAKEIGDSIIASASEKEGAYDEV